MKIPALVCVCALSLFACSHKNENDNRPTVTFSGDIQPMIKSTCATSSCHSGGNEEGSFDTYQGILREVEPGNARGSELYRVITHRSSTIMPPAPATISDDDITRVYLWIEAGAKND